MPQTDFDELCNSTGSVSIVTHLLLDTSKSDLQCQRKHDALRGALEVEGALVEHGEDADRFYILRLRFPSSSEGDRSSVAFSSALMALPNTVCFPKMSTPCLRL